MSTPRQASNPVIRRVRALLNSAADRRAAGMTVLEGAHLLEAYVHAFGTQSLDSVLVRSDMSPESRARIDEWCSSIHPASLPPSTFERLSAVAGENGVLAVVCIPSPRPPSTKQRFEVWLDGVQDPGNAGGIVRTAAAAGATAVVFGAGCADPWSPKCLRGGMGGHFQCSVESTPDLLQRARTFPGRVLATSAHGGQDLYAVDLSGNLAILLGAEGRGLDPSLLEAAQLRVCIPMATGSESLNVGAAAAVLCFERVGQIKRGAPARPLSAS